MVKYKMAVKHPNVNVWINDKLGYFKIPLAKEIIVDNKIIMERLIVAQEATLIETIEGPKIKAEKARKKKD